MLLLDEAKRPHVATTTVRVHSAAYSNAEGLWLCAEASEEPELT